MYSRFNTFIRQFVIQNRRLPGGLAIQTVEGGFPHSEICGSKVVRTSPQLIAAYHVLHRLLAPRHPPNALKALDRSHDQCPPCGALNDIDVERPVCMSNTAALRQINCLTCPLVRPWGAGSRTMFPLHDDKQRMKARILRKADRCTDLMKL
jgi:hypothetical protein